MTPDGLKVKVGDEVEVYLDTFEDNDGELVLSRERAEMLRAWDRISEAYEKDETVEGVIMARVKAASPSTSASRPSSPARRSTCARCATSTS